MPPSRRREGKLISCRENKRTKFGDTLNGAKFLGQIKHTSATRNDSAQDLCMTSYGWITHKKGETVVGAVYTFQQSFKARTDVMSWKIKMLYFALPWFWIFFSVSFLNSFFYPRNIYLMVPWKHCLLGLISWKICISKILLFSTDFTTKWQKLFVLLWISTSFCKALVVHCNQH